MWLFKINTNEKGSAYENKPFVRTWCFAHWKPDRKKTNQKTKQKKTPAKSLFPHAAQWKCCQSKWKQRAWRRKSPAAVSGGQGRLAWLSTDRTTKSNKSSSTTVGNLYFEILGPLRQPRRRPQITLADLQIPSSPPGPARLSTRRPSRTRNRWGREPEQAGVSEQVAYAYAAILYYHNPAEKGNSQHT